MLSRLPGCGAATPGTARRPTRRSGDSAAGLQRRAARRTVEMMGRSPSCAAQPMPTLLYRLFSASVPFRIVPSRRIAWMVCGAAGGGVGVGWWAEGEQAGAASEGAAVGAATRRRGGADSPAHALHAGPGGARVPASRGAAGWHRRGAAPARFRRGRLRAGGTHLHGLLVQDALVLVRVVAHAGDVDKLDAALAVVLQHSQGSGARRRWERGVGAPDRAAGSRAAGGQPAACAAAAPPLRRCRRAAAAAAGSRQPTLAGVGLRARRATPRTWRLSMATRERHMEQSPS